MLLQDEPSPWDRARQGCALRTRCLLPRGTLGPGPGCLVLAVVGTWVWTRRIPLEVIAWDEDGLGSTGVPGCQEEQQGEERANWGWCRAIGRYLCLKDGLFIGV